MKRFHKETEIVSNVVCISALSIALAYITGNTIENKRNEANAKLDNLISETDNESEKEYLETKKKKNIKWAERLANLSGHIFGIGGWLLSLITVEKIINRKDN